MDMYNEFQELAKKKQETEILLLINYHMIISSSASFAFALVSNYKNDSYEFNLSNLFFISA